MTAEKIQNEKKRPRQEDDDAAMNDGGDDGPPDALRVFTHRSICAEMFRLVKREVCAGDADTDDDDAVWSLVVEIRVRLKTLASKVAESTTRGIVDDDYLPHDIDKIDDDVGRNFEMLDPETLWRAVATIARDRRRPRPSVDVAGAPALVFVLHGLVDKLRDAWDARVNRDLARLDLETVDETFALSRWWTMDRVYHLQERLEEALREHEEGVVLRRPRLARFMLAVRDFDFACVDVDALYAKAARRLETIDETRRRLETEFGFSPVERRAAVRRRLLALPDGASGDASVAYVEEDIVDVEDDEFEALWDIGEDIPSTPNPMNPKHDILRKQATFGASYAFAGQRSTKIGGDDPATWPEAIRDMLEVAKTSLKDAGKFADHDLAVHCNWYAGGKAGVEPHDDKEDLFEPDAPIFSFTLYRSGLEWHHDQDHVPRKFQIYAKDLAAKKNVGALLHDVPLPDGSLVVMTGAMQRDFLHGVKKTSAREYENSRRFNATVRVLKKK